MDKLWDDYYEVRDKNQLPLQNEFEFAGAEKDQKIVINSQKYQKVLKYNDKLKLEVEDLKTKLEERDNLIWELRTKLDNEKKTAKWAQTDKARRLMERSELEEFFLSCIDEVRKDLIRRKATSAAYSNKKNMKKSASSKSLEGQYQTNQNERDPKFEEYTATDKKKVIELLMSNENVLLFLYEKLFPVVST